MKEIFAESRTFYSEKKCDKCGEMVEKGIYFWGYHIRPEEQYIGVCKECCPTEKEAREVDSNEVSINKELAKTLDPFEGAIYICLECAPTEEKVWEYLNVLPTIKGL